MGECSEPAFRERVAEEEVQEAGYHHCTKAEPEEPVDLASGRTAGGRFWWFGSGFGAAG
tara:strand:+ start:11384 stop:11560 length:177 start_codon:yes stop_codon:yes gene_type:complete